MKVYETSHISIEIKYKIKVAPPFFSQKLEKENKVKCIT